MPLFLAATIKSNIKWKNILFGGNIAKYVKNQRKIDMENIKRIYRDDNIKFILIFLVVLGHFMELFLNNNLLIFEKFIYSFHMPAFMFISGKHAKFDAGKILKKLIVPYFIFQILYIWLFSAIHLADFKIKFSVPTWLMWYMLSLIFYYILIPMLPHKIKPAIILIIFSFLLSIIVGFDNYIGRYLSLSRAIVFWPYFLIGYYFKDIKETLRLSSKKSFFFIPFSLICLILSEYYILKFVPLTALYGADSYETTSSNFIGRFVFIIAALSALYLLYNLIPDLNIPVISKTGKNTVLIFLLHGFIVKYLGYIGLFHFSANENLPIALILTIFIVFILGCPAINNVLFHKGFSHVHA